MKLSIIIPYYRSPVLLAKTLESIQCSIFVCLGGIENNTFEVIIVDDSMDSSFSSDLRRVIADYASQHYSVLVIENEVNQGIANSRNIGADKASGEFLHFIDQDDFISKSFYSEMLAAFNPQIDLMISDCYTKKGLVTTSYFRASLKKKLESTADFSSLKILALFNLFPSVGQFLIRKTLFNVVDGYPVLSHQGTDDWGLWLRFLTQGATFKTCFNSVFIYNIHESNSRKILDMKQSANETLKSFYFISRERLGVLGRTLILCRIYAPTFIIKCISYPIVIYYCDVPTPTTWWRRKISRLVL